MANNNYEIVRENGRKEEFKLELLSARFLR